jgi:hypothetical protein
MGDPFDEGKVMLDDDDGGSRGDESLNRRSHAFAEYGVYAPHWFIQDHETGLSHANARKLEEPFLTATKIPRPFIAQLAEAELYQYLALKEACRDNTRRYVTSILDKL